MEPGQSARSQKNGADPISLSSLVSQSNPGSSFSELVSEFAHGSYLEQYVERLENSQHLSPQEFIDQLGISIDGSQKVALLRELRSVQLTFEIGERLRHANPADPLPKAKEYDLPSQIGDFRILREIGRGGMGIVYEAEQLSLGRHVALKVLPPHAVFDPRHLERFLRESKAAARMNHNNIVPVFGIGEHDGVHCYVMQYVPGLGLDVVLSELKQQEQMRVSGRTEDVLAGVTAVDTGMSGDDDEEVKIGAASSSSSYRLPGQEKRGAATDSDRSYWQSVARIGVQVADALDYAHAQGVLHRDIKPSNLLLDENGTAWVTDFGLAKEMGSDNLTRTGDIVGTLKYLAPECLEGRSDERGDIYGLGVTLYELITLRAPFEAADRHALIRQVMFGEPPRPRSIRSGIPLDLETIVLKSIARDPADRYSTAGDLEADLNRFLNDRPIHARRQSRMEGAWRWCRRNPVLASMGGAVSVLLTILGISLLIAAAVRGQRDMAIANLNRAEVAEQSARASLERAELAEREVRWRNHLAQAGLIRRNGGLGQRTNSLAEIDKALAAIEQHTPDSRRELANELIAELALTDVTYDQSVPCSMNAKVDIDLAFQHLAICEQLGFISLRRLDNNEEILKLDYELNRVVVLRFSPDGKYLAASGDVSGGFRLSVWRVSDGHHLWDSDCAENSAFDFIPNCDQVFVARPDEWTVCDLSTGVTLRSAPPGSTSDAVVRISPNGKSFYIHPISPNDIEFYSFDDFKGLGTWESPNGFFGSTWHPTRSEIAVGVNDGSVHIVRVGESKSYRNLPGDHGMGVHVAFSADGTKLLSNDWAGRFRLWDFESGRILLKETINAEPLRFGPEGQRLGIFRDGGAARIGTIIASDVYRPLPRDNRSVEVVMRNAAFHPSGTWLAVGTLDGFEVFDMLQNRLLAIDRSHFSDKDIEIETDRMLTRSSAGVRQWPLSLEANNWTIGPHQSLIGQVSNQADQIATTDRYWVVAVSNGALLFPKSDLDNPIHLQPHRDCRFVAASSDGQWIATGSHWGVDVKVWTPTGELVATLPIKASSFAKFSPNNKWLVTSGGGNRLWSVGNWREVATLGGQMAGSIGDFSPDSRFLVYHKQGSSRLFDLATLEEFGQLIEPDSDRVTTHVFSPDGSQLLMVESSSVWDIRRIREELSQRGLDWDVPDLPPARKSSRSSEPMQVKILHTDEPVVGWTPESLFEHYKNAFQPNPNDAMAQNNYAWSLVTGPEELRDAELGLELATKAVAQDATNDMYVNTLGVANYRAGNFQASVDMLMQNLARSDDVGLPFDLYFIAMGWAKLDEPKLAENFLLMANRWTDQQLAAERLPQNYQDELPVIRAEAEVLISNNEKAIDKKANADAPEPDDKDTSADTVPKKQPAPESQ